MYGVPLEPTDLQPLGYAGDEPGGARGAILRRWLSGPRLTDPADLDAAVVRLIEELDELEA